MELTEDDIAYVRRWFVPLAELCGARALDLDRLPGPAYVLDGVPMVAPEHLDLLDEAGSIEALPGYFAARYQRAAARLARAPTVAEAWDGYLSGLFAVCLRVVTPEAIARKEHLVATIDAALATPQPGDAAWCGALRCAVTALDALERDFTAYDRVRFGRPTTRDRCITGVRTAYASIFGGVPSSERPVAPAPRVRRDLAVRLPHRPGALAALGEVLGRAGVSLEGGGGFAVGDHAIVHFLVADAVRAADALGAANLEVLGVRDVLVAHLDQETPGQLGLLARAMADAGVNLDCVYSDHDHALILCVDDPAAGQQVLDRWRRRA